MANKQAFSTNLKTMLKIAIRSNRKSKFYYYFYPMLHWTLKHRYGAALASGLLLVLSFPFTGSMPFLALFALVPLLLVEYQISENKYRSSKLFVHSYLTFLIYNVGTTWWIWNASAGGAIFAFTLNALIMAVVFQFFHSVKKRLGANFGYAAFVFFWISFEFIHYYWELSWPWLNLGNVFASMPEGVQWYSVSGVLGGTAWILLCNLLVFRLVQKRFGRKQAWSALKREIYGLTALVLLPLSYSLIVYATYDLKIGKKSEVVVTQPNVDPYNEKYTGSVNDQLNRICDLADKHATEHTDFVLAPETALPFSFYEDEIQRVIYYHYLVERKAKWENASLLIGASTKKYFKRKQSRASKKIYGGPGFEEYYNSSLLIDQYDHPSFVHKSKLVLGVEKVPFSHVFPALEELSINNGGTTGTLGIEDESQVLCSNGICFAPVVCYESIYGEFVAEQCRKGAELIFVITNDGWWGDTPGYKQHMALARLRAVECRKYIARSANTGTSCFIDPLGNVSEASGWWKEDAIKKTLFRNQESTLFIQWGNWVGRLSAGASILLLAYWLSRIFLPFARLSALSSGRQGRRNVGKQNQA